jgi:hypothetical protein
MHLAVVKKDKLLVKLLDQYNGDAKMPNNDGVSAIDTVIIEDIRDIRLYFQTQHKY